MASSPKYFPNLKHTLMTDDILVFKTNNRGSCDYTTTPTTTTTVDVSVRNPTFLQNVITFLDISINTGQICIGFEADKKEKLHKHAELG